MVVLPRGPVTLKVPDVPDVPLSSRNAASARVDEL